MEKLYAWCRWCDDGVDHAASPAEAASIVDSAVDDVRLIQNGESPRHAESLWLADVSRRHPIPPQAAEALLAGMRSDLTPASGLTLDELTQYCFRVAGAVGVMMCPILGLRRFDVLPHAAALGMGMQLTNIARDVGEDWDRGRCYLPVEWTDGLRPTAPRPSTDQIRSAVAKVLDLAESYYAAGEIGVAALPRSSRLAVRSAARVYRAIGDRIRRNRYSVMHERAFVSTGQKLRLVAVSALGRSGGRGTARGSHNIYDALRSADHTLREHGVTR